MANPFRQAGDPNAAKFLEWLTGVQARTGMNSYAIEEAIKRGNLDFNTATADDVWNAFTGRQLPGPAKEYVRPTQAADVSPEPPDMDTRIMGRPGVRQMVEPHMAAIAQMNPSLAARLEQGDPESFYEAIRMISRADGELVPPAAARQMELPLRDNVPTGFSADVIGPIPSGPMFVTSGRRRPPLPGGGGFADYGRMLEDGGSRLSSEIDSLLSRLSEIRGQVPSRAPRIQAVEPLSPVPSLRRPAQDLGAGGGHGGRAERMPDAPPARSKARDAAAAGAVAAGGAALVNMMSPMETGGEADLAAETSPAPSVEATPEKPEPTVVQAPVDYSLEARKLIDQLNAMRRKAGGEVPEAAAMQREIQRLMDLGNKTRRATYAAAPQDDASSAYQQAQGLIDQVNQMYRQGMTPNSPQVRQIMTKVRQLQQQGDAMRNRRSA